MHFAHSENMSILSRQLQNVHNEKEQQITTTLTRMSLQEQAMLKTNKSIFVILVTFFILIICIFFFYRSLADKLAKLQEALDDRKLAFNALSSKNTLIEADLTLAKQQYDELKNQMKRVEIDQEQNIHKIRRECQQEKQVDR